MRQDLHILVLELKLSRTDSLIIGNYKSPSLNDITFRSETLHQKLEILQYFINHQMRISYLQEVSI